MNENGVADEAEKEEVSKAANEPSEVEKSFEEISIKFGKGLVGDPFIAKSDGKEYVSIKIPNKDEQDKTPWASFVVPANHVHDNQFGKGVWIKIPEQGRTTLTKPEKTDQIDEKTGKNIWKDTKVVVTNQELKATMEVYKTRNRESVLDNLQVKKDEIAREPQRGQEQDRNRAQERT